MHIPVYPAWRLIEAVSTLRNRDGKILIKDWYKEVSALSKNDLKIIQKEPFLPPSLSYFPQTDFMNSCLIHFHQVLFE